MNEALLEIATWIAETFRKARERLTMTEAEWLTSNDPLEMLQHLTHTVTGASFFGARLALRDSPLASDRKLRLFGHALWEAYRRRGYLPSPPTAFDQTARLNLAWIDGLIGRTQDNDWNLHTMEAAEFARDAITHYTKAGIVPRRLMTPAGLQGNRQRLPVADAVALMRDVVGNPFRPLWPTARPYFATLLRDQPHVATLAHAAYDERIADGALDLVRLMVLADALEELGCSVGIVREYNDGGTSFWYNEAFGTDWPHLTPDRAAEHPIIAHLRSPGPHVRGCWAIDLVLGKE